ncbi:DNA-processing protein DprA [Singulisphaera sp. PoT]|uniref:DNA-processing protein DprA n=1 Tax=Singulisphaera sp. PoT TaxID=3411797 RepID=UPI003BF45F94
MTETEIRDLLCLSLVQGVGPHTSRALLERFETAGRVLNATISELREVQGVGPKLAEKINRARRDIDAAEELAFCRSRGVRVIPQGDSSYPPTLAEIPDPPSLLFTQGTIEPRDQLAIAIVGSRRCTPYGLRVAERLGSALARVGLTVVSGLARGIDAAAHRGALKVGGRTFGVMANGLAEIYPPEHEELAHQIAESGAVISEMPMRQGPLAGLFPQRNRIISGLCLGVVVVEATPRSGSLSTAHHAMEQNREVFAVPGPVDSLSSQGCHRLIRDGARLVETVDDILEELGPLVREVKTSKEEPAVRRPVELTLSDQERSILGHLDDQPQAVDALIARTRLTASQVMATLSVLEMRRLIRRLPGQHFVRA